MNNEQEEDAIAIPVVNFIEDKTAEIDRFRSHTRIANAAAAVISHKRDLKVIGLLGPWGSGKSTVIKFIGDRLEKDQPGERILCFSYDAWLHQSDPPRRSFLEVLLRFLIAKGLTTEARWTTELSKLNRQIEDTEVRTTPTLSIAGRFLLPVILAVPFGMQLLDKDWYNEWGKINGSWLEYNGFFLGLLLVFAPALVALVLFFWWRPWGKIKSKEFWKNFWNHRPPYDGESIFSIFTNKERTSEKSTTIRSPDPTTIEFQNLFREILKEIKVDNQGRPVRFVFVIDNLDRLPEAAAVDMWGTVRSFFLGNHSEFRLPTVILPIDEQAVERMYEVDHPQDARKLAKSFMDKTFDLSFRVTPPVLSNWQNYIATQLAHMFGPSAEAEWPVMVGSIYRDWHAENGGSQPITPREINTVLNRIGTLYTQWHGEGIHFASIAAYAICRAEIDADIFTAVRRAKWGAHRYDRDWALSLAAMHYGVLVADAAQILLDDRIKEALSAKSSTQLASMADAPGFEMVLHNVIADPNSEVLLSRVTVHLKALGNTDSHWREASWAALRQRQFNRIAGERFSAQDAEAYNAIVDSVPAAQREQYFDRLANHYAKMPPAAFSTLDTTKAIAGALYHFLREARKYGHNYEFNLKAPAARYLQVLCELAKTEVIAKAIGSEETDDAILEALAKSFGEKSPPFARQWAVYGLWVQQRKLTWDPAIEAAVSHLRDTLGDAATDAAYMLGRLRDDPTAKSTIDGLIDSGQLQSRFHEAYAAKHLAAPGLAALLIISKDPSQVTTPDGETWDKALDSNTEFAKKLADSLLAISINSLETYANFVKVTGAPGELLRRAATALFKADQLELPKPADVGSNHERYYQAITFEMDLKLLEYAAASEEFWIALKDAEFAGLESLFSILLGNDNPYVSRAKALLHDKLDRISEETWKAAIAKASFPKSMVDLIDDEVDRPIAGALPGALTQMIGSLKSGDKAFRDRWLLLASKLSKATRRTLLKSVADVVVMPEYPRPTELLAAASGILVREGDLQRHAEDVVRVLLIPLLSTNENLQWLGKNARDLVKSVAKADALTREALHEHLSNAARRDREAQKGAEALQTAWHLPPLKVAIEETSVNDGEDAGEEVENGE